MQVVQVSRASSTIFQSTAHADAAEGLVTLGHCCVACLSVCHGLASDLIDLRHAALGITDADQPNVNTQR